MIKDPRVRFFINAPRHFFDLVFRGYYTRPSRAIIEISCQCNFNCALCSYNKKRFREELPDKEWEKRVNQILSEYPSLVGAIWLGGEPLFRLELIEKLSKKFFYNVICTNGTLPLKKIKNTIYWVSVDGTKECFEKLRGSKYDKIKKNIVNSKVKDIVIVCLLSKTNKICIEEFVLEWSKVKNVKKILFSFHTPSKENKDDPDWLTFKERDKVIKKIIKLAKNYPILLEETARSLRALLSYNLAKTNNACHKSARVYLNPLGEKVFHKKYQDAMCGRSNTNCERCATKCSIIARTEYSKRFPVLFSHLLRK